MVERVFELKKSRSKGENVSREWGLHSTEWGQWKGGSCRWGEGRKSCLGQEASKVNGSQCYRLCFILKATGS